MLNEVHRINHQLIAVQKEIRDLKANNKTNFLIWIIILIIVGFLLIVTVGDLINGESSIRVVILKSL